MDGLSFVQQLDAELQHALAPLAAAPIAPTGEKQKAIIELLKMGLKSEIEASEIAASWMLTTPEMEIKLGLARQCGDEAKHFALMQKRLLELGVDARQLNPVAHGYSPLFHYLRTLHPLVERLAAAQYAREGIAKLVNAKFIEFVEEAKDTRTAALFRETVQPEEAAHHEFARQMLAKYANTPELQDKARAAMRKTLELADELRELASHRLGTAAIPGS